MASPDPFGFVAAINWDAVDEHADEIAEIFEEDPDHDPEYVASQTRDEDECEEPCCYPFFQTRGVSHAYGCDLYDGL